MEQYIVYVQTDKNQNLIDINSSLFITNLDGWEKIDQGSGDKYCHAQNCYLKKPLYTEDGNPRYKIKNGVVVERNENEIDNDRLPSIKELKINELREKSDKAINTGTIVELSAGKENFTYSIEDQSNISEMFVAVGMGVEEYSYHQNGMDCRMFNKQDIVVLYATLSMYKTSLLTYFNQLKSYVLSLASVEEVEKVIYGQELTGAYLEKYNELMSKNKAQMDNLLAKLNGMN